MSFKFSFLDVCSVFEVTVGGQVHQYAMKDYKLDKNRQVKSVTVFDESENEMTNRDFENISAFCHYVKIQ